MKEASYTKIILYSTELMDTYLSAQRNCLGWILGSNSDEDGVSDNCTLDQNTTATALVACFDDIENGDYDKLEKDGDDFYKAMTALINDCNGTDT